jgi:hypothetical protein
MFNVTELMGELSRQRAVFHSEADFQHTFAWEIHRRMPHAEVRLERPIFVGGKTLHLDCLVTQGKMAVAIELKYKTR